MLRSLMKRREGKSGWSIGLDGKRANEEAECEVREIAGGTERTSGRLAKRVRTDNEMQQGLSLPSATLARLGAALLEVASFAFLAAATKAGAALPEERKRAWARWTFVRLTA